MTRGIRGAAKCGGLVIVALVLWACDPYRPIVVVNDSNQTLIARVDGFSSGEGSLVSLPAHSAVTVAHYGAGGYEPFLVKQVEILGRDCAVLGAISTAQLTTSGGMIRVGADLNVQLDTASNPQEGASPTLTTLCSLPTLPPEGPPAS
jgi:hypothetical protein